MTDTDKTKSAGNPLFDDYADEYEDACHRGLALSGEGTEFFAAERIGYTARWLAALGEQPILRVADFGCGVGSSAVFLRKHFPEADLIGLDVSAASIEKARSKHGNISSFALLDDLEGPGSQELVYCNGVFHHIPPADRRDWAVRIRKMLAPGGHLALWENNPWNPGARMVMRRIPFDRDAIPVAPPEARHMLAGAGFDIIGTRFRFYFPRSLSLFRRLERYGERIPLGAQYCVLACRRGGE